MPTRGKGARLLYNRFGDSGNDIESSGATTLLGRILREQVHMPRPKPCCGRRWREERGYLGKPTTVPSPTDFSWRRHSFRSANTPRPIRYSSAHWAQHRSGRRGGTEELRIVNLLGLVQLQLGRHAESEALLKQALADTRDLDDKRSVPARSGTMYILARSLNAANKFTEAEKCARESGGPARTYGQPGKRRSRQGPARARASAHRAEQACRGRNTIATRLGH